MPNMEDDTLDTGLSGWAWYELGRSRAAHDASVAGTMRRMFGPKRPAIDVNGLITQNQALAAENARLRQDLAAYEHNYAKLRTWAEEARRDLKRLRGEPG
jgi:hypothetical protein